MEIHHQNAHLRIKRDQFNSNNYYMTSSSLAHNLTTYYPKGNVTISYINKNLKKLDVAHEKKNNKQLIIDQIGEKGYDYIEHFIDTNSSKTQLIYNSLNKSTDQAIYENSVSLTRFNSIANLDSFLINVNNSMAENGKFIGMVKTNKQFKENQWIRKIPIVGKLSTLNSFIIHRICPKLNGFKQLYFGLTQGRQLRLSKAEVLGRLIKFGFKIIELEDDIDGQMYFVVKKIKKPDIESKASNGLIYKFPRVGKNGKMIGVYKVRTMHPYSEYLQDYIVNTNGYGANGKPSKDFRIPSWARFVRRYWLDELPQLANVLKGEMKLLGVRPVTVRYLQDIPEHIQKLRLTQKPGCIPPYVAYNKESSKESVLTAEENYLNLPKKGILVDLRLMSKAIKNILFNKKRGA